MKYLKALYSKILDFFGRKKKKQPPKKHKPHHPQKRRKAEKERRIALERMFQVLDRVVAVESRFKIDNSGEQTDDLRKMTRRIGAYIDSAPFDEAPTTVDYQDKLGLPAIFAVAPLWDNGHNEEYLRGEVMQMVTISGFLMDKAPKAVDHKGKIYQAAATYAYADKQKRWGGTRKGAGAAGHFYVAIDEDGSPKIPDINGKPPSVVLHIASNQDGDIEAVKESLEENFARAINLFRSRDMNWMVKVEHRDKRLARATFGVRPLDVPSVFNSRVKVKTPSGRSKPIYHPVRTHERQHKGGVSLVQLHHRGLREFVWRGYQCEVQIPGKHNLMANSFTLAAGKLKPGEKGYTATKVANMLVTRGAAS